MIVGNVEEYIDRCLRSFAPLADEFCIVQAIGNQPSDGTIARAEALAKELGKEFKTAIYYNQAGHADWPHVDDFAAARQMSFDLATGDYCFWCDSDDVLESGAEIVRELADRGGYPVFIFPYRIFGRGVVVLRERMMVHQGKWKYPVHEAYQFPVKVEGVRDDRVVVKHLPKTTKTGSHERNLRILQSIPEEERTCGQWYHLHGELAGTPEGIEAAKRALAHPDLGRPEKYELFLNLARLAEKPAMKQKLLHEAYMANPTRREALGLLSGQAIDEGRAVDALAYARQMMATVKPDDEEWNDREAAYDWLGVEIYTHALRVNGRAKEAEQMRRASLVANGGARISLIHATRGRPREAAIARKLWLDLAEKPGQVEHIFVIDEDDELSTPLKRMHHLVIPEGGGCVAAWNHGLMATGAPVVVQMSDDWTPLPGWDQLIIDRIGDVEKPAVLAVSDGIRSDKLLCMAICTRVYCGLDQFLFHPWFKGVYSDNYFTEMAYRRGVVIEARDLVFTHNHPLATGKPMDETYQIQNSADRYREGKAIFDELMHGNNWCNVPGFFNFWGFYNLVANRLKDGDIVCEVGVWMGRSIIYLAQLLKRQGKKVRLFAVDSFQGEANQPAHAEEVAKHGGNFRAEFEANIRRCGVDDCIQIIESDSALAAARFLDGMLAFCFIDAAHDYESVKRDVSAWLPKVKPDGIFAGHDAQYEPVERAVKELIPDAFILLPVWAKIP
jgi:SAM-dependent methyltransferase